MNTTLPLASIIAHAEVANMNAIVQTRYGAPDVLRLEREPRPTPGPSEVLVRVHAAGVSIGDHHIVTGTPYVIRLTPFGGVRGPKHRVPGSAMAGVIEALGPDVTDLKIGDAVFGETLHGAFAELVVVAADRLALKPANLSFEEAAATPWAVTALQALRDAARLQPGQRVLINGASGAVGGWAVQIAKALGAEVTAVCSTRNIERVRALGADHVIDYTQTDFVAGGARFDVMLDTVGNRSVGDCKRVLTPRGTYVACTGGDSTFGWLARTLRVALTSMFSRRSLKSFLVKPTRADLLVLRELIEAGKLRPSIERTVPLAEVGSALTRVGAGHSQGQTIVSMGV